MANTTNYAWVKPTVSGSSGAWGTLLNTIFDDIDTDLKAVSDASDAIGDRVTALEADGIAFPIILGCMSGFPDGFSPAYASYSQAAGLGLDDNSPSPNPTTAIFLIPIEGLKAGQTITGFKSRGQAPTNTTLTVGISSVASNSDSNTSSGLTVLSHSSTKATLTRTGGNITVVAGTRYYFEVTMTRTSLAITPRLLWVQPTVTA